MSLTRLLLICGIVAAAWFIAMDIAAGTLFYPGYDYGSQQVSELSAIGAPSRDFWMAMGYPYAILNLAFAIGVWRAAVGRSTLRFTAVLIGLFTLNSFLWGLVAPMHMRGAAFTATDAAHIAFAGSAVALMVAFMSLGALALGRSFRIFSTLTVVAMLAAGAVVSTQIGTIAEGLPTPWMGLVERISVYSPTVWMAVFATVLMEVGSGAERPGVMHVDDKRLPRSRASLP